jgi:hypothetical protein
VAEMNVRAGASSSKANSTTVSLSWLPTRRWPPSGVWIKSRGSRPGGPFRVP